MAPKSPVLAEPEEPLEPAVVDLLNSVPEERGIQQCDGIVKILEQLAPEFTAGISDDQMTEVAKVCMYHYFTAGHDICTPTDETAFFFIVLHGTVEIEERRVTHLEGATGTQASMRTTTAKTGTAFHHYPLVMQSPFYGYNARVTDPAGASLLLLSRSDYVSILRKTVDKEMSDTVRAPLLRASTHPCTPAPGHGCPLTPLAKQRVASFPYRCACASHAHTTARATPRHHFPGLHAARDAILLVVVGYFHLAPLLLVHAQAVHARVGRGEAGR